MNSETNCASCDSEQVVLDRVRQVLRSFKGQQGALIQALHTVQGIYGYLPLEVQRIVAEELNIPIAEVSGVTTFYSFFSDQPRGKHTIRICLGTACYVRGGVSILDALQKQLGISVGNTTKDGMFTFEVARCIGACGLAPAMVIDTTMYPQVKPDDLAGIIQSWYKKDEEEGV